MKIHINHLFLSAGITLQLLSSSSVSAQGPPPGVGQPPPHVHGRVKKFVAPPQGWADIGLFEGGPSIQCDTRPARGPPSTNARTCTSGMTTVTVVDAVCPENLFGPPNDGCVAASIVDVEAGIIYHVSSDGTVNSRNSADYPEEEHAPNEDLPPEDFSEITERRLLRGEATQQHRSLQTPIIDVLVVYTQGAKASAANYGDGPIENLINLAITETNEAYANSNINAELNLIAMHEDTSGYTADVGSSSMSPSLYHLTYQAGNSNDPDGLLDYVHQMRTDVGADMVALITTGAGCGIAWLSGNSMTSNPSKSWMFSVTKYSCATGNYSFGHELGHNMGCNHDKGTKDTCGSNDYRYGYRGENGQYRSVLSYSCNTSQCDANPGGSCTRSQFFSHPGGSWLGNPTGHAAGSSMGETNNAAKINLSAPVIANFYDSGTAAPTTHPTPPPTQSPQPPTPPPTNAPTSPPTTGQPTSSPTPGPTGSPVVCTLAKVDESCTDGVDCCSGLCSGGKPANRVCLPNGPTTPTTPAPAGTPTCLGKGAVCPTDPKECCSGQCEIKGQTSKCTAP